MHLFLTVSPTAKPLIVLLVFVLSLVDSEAPSFKLCGNLTKTNHKSFCNNSFRTKDRVDPYEITSPKQHPYAVAVYCKRGKVRDICSGTLLTRSWIITAKHCFHNCRRSYVYAGGNDMNEVHHNYFPEESQLLRIGKICPHKYFDVSLAKVKTGFAITEYVKPIQIPVSLLQSEIIKCSFTGFGRILVEKESPSLDFRRKTQVIEVVSPCDCYYRGYRDHADWEKFADGSNFMCSLPHEDYGICNGDSGAGLVYNGVLQAVTSSIISNTMCYFKIPFTRNLVCGSRDTSSVFVSVYPLVGWIDETISDPNYAKCINNANTAIPCASLAFGLYFVLRGLLDLAFIASFTNIYI